MSVWNTLQSGFGIIHRSVLKGDLSRGAKLVYALLCSYANSETGKAFPSQETMASDLGCSEKPVRRWLDELVRDGKIIKSLEGMPAHNVYVVLYPSLQSGSVVPDKTGSVVPLKYGSVLPAKNNNEKGKPALLTARLPNSKPASHEVRSSEDEEKVKGIAQTVPWRRRGKKP